MILDEYVLAEEILSSKREATKNDLSVIAKYVRNEMKCDVSESLVILTNVLSKINKNFNPIKSAKYLEKLIVKSEGLPLRQVEYIKITSRELGTISNIQSQKLQRLLFSLLVYSKFHNTLSSNNNNWCNIKINDLYRTAKVSTKNSKEKALLLNKLLKMGYISFSKSNTNLNIKCNIIDVLDDKDSIKITDIRELGYQYINLKEPEQFTYCENCGVIIRKKTKKDYSTKMCNSCLNTIKNESCLNWFYEFDKADTSLAQ